MPGRLKHHFVEMETESGAIFSVEKTKKCILLQQCPTPKKFSMPQTRHWRDGQRRVPLEAMHDMETIVEDEQPLPRESVEEVVRWIQGADLMHDDYDIGETRKGQNGQTVSVFSTVISLYSTVKPRYTGPKSNGNPPITNAEPWFLQVISFYFLYWQ